MPAQTSWASETPAVNRRASLEIQDAKSARDALDSNELCGSGLPGIVGNSAALRDVLEMVRIVAPTDATVLINGETVAASPAVHTIKESVMAKVIEFFRMRSCVPVSPNRERLSSFLRRQGSQSRLDQLAGCSVGSWQRRSRTML
jgi:hypothetical protein